MRLPIWELKEEWAVPRERAGWQAPQLVSTPIETGCGRAEVTAAFTAANLSGILREAPRRVDHQPPGAVSLPARDFCALAGHCHRSAVGAGSTKLPFG